jgi:hypothetical protein
MNKYLGSADILIDRKLFNYLRFILWHHCSHLKRIPLVSGGDLRFWLLLLNHNMLKNERKNCHSAFLNYFLLVDHFFDLSVFVSILPVGSKLLYRTKKSIADSDALKVLLRDRLNKT